MEGFKANIHEIISELNAADLEKNGTTTGHTLPASVLVNTLPIEFVTVAERKNLSLFACILESWQLAPEKRMV
jgi:hypothetical protein